MIDRGDHLHIAARWLEATLLGSAATAIAVIAVGAFGIGLLTGRMDLRRGIGVIVGRPSGSTARRG